MRTDKLYKIAVFAIILALCLGKILTCSIPVKASIANGEYEIINHLTQNSFVEDRFELGNSVNVIFQEGTEYSAENKHFLSDDKGLYDYNDQKYITDYKVYNINYFDGILYYSVLDDATQKSRIEKYDVFTSEKQVIYVHPGIIGQMYCVNNDYFLFLSENRLYQKSVFPIDDVKVIQFEKSQMEEIPIFGLIPTRKGNVLIGNRANDYTIFVNGTVFKENVYSVSEDDGYLILSIDGKDYQVNIDMLMDNYYVQGEELYENNVIRYGSGNASLNENLFGADEERKLLKICDLYPEFNMGDLFTDSAYNIARQDTVSGYNEEVLYPYNLQDGDIYEYDNDLSLQRAEAFENEIKDYEEDWTSQREESLMNFLGYLTRSMVDLAGAQGEKKYIRNILMNAREMIEIKWVFVGKNERKTEFGHKDGTNNYKYYNTGHVFFGLPYQQWGTYVGYNGVTLKKFISIVGDANHSFYTEIFRSGSEHNEELCLSYGTDCSGFVGYSLDIIDTKHSVYMLTENDNTKQDLIVKVTDDKKTISDEISKMRVGDFLAGDGHCVLIAGILREGTAVKAIVTLESQTWTTASRQNINVYIDSADETEKKRIIASLFGVSDSEEEQVENWIKDIAKTNSKGEISSFSTLRERISNRKFCLYRAKNRGEISHIHDHGITIHYNDTIADDVCCLECYNEHHDVEVTRAPHWNGGNGSICVFCGYVDEHTHVFSDWISCIDNTRHERTCTICGMVESAKHAETGIWCGSTGICYICGANVMSEYTTHDYEYVDNDASTHTKRCRRSGCGYEIEEKHTPKQQGGIECICGRIICKHNSTNKEIDADGHVIICSVCQELISRGKHNFKPYRAGNEPIYNGIIDIELHGDICKQDSLDKVDDSRICLYTADNGALSAVDTIDLMGVVDPAIGHNLICIDCGYIAKGTAPHKFTDIQQISGNASHHKLVCECGFSLEVSHSFKIEDAVKQGCHKYCTECGYEEYYDHDYTAYKVTKEATCTEKGEKYRTCKTCGHVHVKGIPATGHDYSKRETKEVQCKENGYERIVCSRCGDIQSETIIPYPGHDYESPVIISKATCTEPGRRTKRCKTCGFVKEYNYPDAKGHNYETKTVDATCTTDGYTREVCSRCGDIKSETVITSPGHSYGAYVVTKQPTCTAKGSKTKTCTVCGHTYTKKIAVIDHDYSEATCTKPATCKMCGATNGTATGHNYGSFSVTSPASCTSTGTKSRTCSKCGHVDTEVIPLEPHKYNKKGKCKVCGAKK